MRLHEIELILKWIGFHPDKLITEQMILEAIKYAYDMGYTDGSQ